MCDIDNFDSSWWNNHWCLLSTYLITKLFFTFRRETEAVEQVRQSVHMAEQISLEKTQLELELAQVKQQLERQQDRIKGTVYY